MATKKPKTNMNRYRLSEHASALTQFAHGDNVYPVVDGIVELPATETWYQYMVGSMLVPARDDEAAPPAPPADPIPPAPSPIEE